MTRVIVNKEKGDKARGDMVMDDMVMHDKVKGDKGNKIVHISPSY